MKEDSLVTVWCGDMSSYGMFMVLRIPKEHCQKNYHVLGSKRYVNSDEKYGDVALSVAQV